jgi:hypothetical protein
MHPVRTDDEIEPACARTLECHVHTVVVLDERHDGIAEDVLGVVGARGVKDEREVAARDLDVVGREQRSRRPDIDTRESG